MGPIIESMRPPASYRIEKVPGLQLKDIFGQAAEPEAKSAETAVVPLSPSVE